MLFTTAMTGAVVGMPLLAHAGPEGGIVTGGNANISNAGPSTTITQSTDRAVIKWNSFDLNSSESVKFIQPNSSSITLNRINDSKASTIDGKLEANGRIMLLNSNGIVFGANAKVDVAGIVATTSEIDDAAFMSGAQTLSLTPGGKPDAKIINNGQITAKEAGLVGLVGPHVENNGVIQAKLGRVTLAGAERVTLDLAGDNLITIDVTDQVNGTVKNTGDIIADGGTITLTASRARDAVETSIINTGRLQANSVGTKNGRIILSAGGHKVSNPAPAIAPPKAAVVNKGTIEAKALNYAEVAGKVDILGDAIELTETSVIDVSGVNNAGTVHIGGDKQGTGERPTADWVKVDHGSVIRADNTYSGDGGSVILWADRLMFFRGRVEAEAEGETGNGGFVEVSGKNILNYDGEVSTKSKNGKLGTLLLDPTNITISSSADQNVNGASPFSPTANDVTSNLNITTLQNALASSNVTVQTRATGSQLGDITVSGAITWASGNTLTLDAHHDVIINQTINGAGLTLIAGNDVQLNATITTPTLTIYSSNATASIGVGNGEAGTLLLNTTDLNQLAGVTNLILGNTAGSGAINIAARTWGNNVTFNSGTGSINIHGAQTTNGYNLTFKTDGDVSLGSLMTGTGVLTFATQTASGTMGIGASQTGNLNLDATDLGNFTNGYTLVLGRSDGTGTMNFGAVSLGTLTTINSGSGTINFNGALAMIGGKNLTVNTNGDINLAGSLTGSGVLTLATSSANAAIGIGTGQTGAITLDTTEIGRITAGWTNVVLGRTDGTGTINMGAATWTKRLIVQSDTGTINIAGAQTMGANNLTFNTNADIAINAALTGTGTLTFDAASNATTFGIGTGQTGTISFSNTELTNITDGWTLINFGLANYNGAINFGTYSWLDSVTSSTKGIININGNQTMNANNLTLQSNTDVVIGGQLAGSGNLIISGSGSTSIGIGTGQTGSIALSDAEVANLVDGWALITFGSSATTGNINVSAKTWTDAVQLRNSGAGIISINGAQTMGTNGLTISTDSDLSISAALTGTGSLTIAPTSTGKSIGVGTGQTGDILLSDTELNYIGSGFGTITFGSTTNTGNINIGARTWASSTTFMNSGNGIINVNGAQAMGTRALTLSTDSDINIGASLTGTGALTITQTSAGVSMGVGTGQTGTINVSDTELNYITDGWNRIVFGINSLINLTLNVGARTWTDSVELRVGGGTSSITINGNQNLNGNNLTILAYNDLTINAQLAGTGTLAIGGGGTTTMGVGTGQAGMVSLIDSELAMIQSGWAEVILGSSFGSGTLNVGAYSWNNNTTFTSSTGQININGAQTMGSKNLTIKNDGDVTFGANITGTGTLTFTTKSTAGTIAIGAGQTGGLNIDATDISKISSGFTNVVFGRTDGTGNINIGNATFANDVLIQSNTGVMSIPGTVVMNSGKSLTINTNTNPVLTGSLSGTGTLTIATTSASISIGLGASQAGTLNLDAAEISKILAGWSSVVIGRTDGTGAINMGVATWNAPLTVQSNTGVITINGAQTMSANNLKFSTNVDMAINAALTGTGSLTFAPISHTTTIGIGTGQTGTINFSNAELANITDGWANIGFGASFQQLGGYNAVINIGAYTWLDNVFFGTNSTINVNGNQTFSAGNNSQFILQGGTDVILGAQLIAGNSGSSGYIYGVSGTSIGVGTGQTGNIALSDAELNNIVDGWAYFQFGATATTGNINVAAHTWTDSVAFKNSGAGILSFNGAQNTGTNAMWMYSDQDISINAAITGASTLTIASTSNGVSMAVGSGQTGTIAFSDTELGYLTDGWGSIVFGNINTGTINIAAHTWLDPITFMNYGSNVINVNGAQTMGTNNLTFSTDANIKIGGNLTGTGKLYFASTNASTTMAIGSGQTGTIAFSDTELGYLADGWNTISFGTTASTVSAVTLNIAAHTWTDNIYFGGTAVNINGDQNFGSNGLQIQTYTDPTINGKLIGTGSLSFYGGSFTSMGIGTGQSGIITLSDADIINIQQGWASIIFGAGTTSATSNQSIINVGTTTWLSNITFRSYDAVININGAQTMGSKSLTITTDGDVALNAALNGTGTLTLSTTSNAGTMGIGAGQTGGLNIDTTDISRIGSGWTSVVLGSTAGTGAINVGDATFANNVTLQSNTGVMTIAGAVAMGTKNLTINTNANPVLTGSLAGTGTLTIAGASASTTIGLGASQTGTLNLDATEISKILTGWTTVTIGRSDGTGAINMGTATWSVSPEILSNTGVITINGNQTMGTNNLTFTTNADIAVNAALTGTGTLTFGAAANATTIGVGTGQAGTISFSNTELANITDGWTLINFGLSNYTGAVNLGVYTWLDNVYAGTKGTVTVNGKQTMGSNNLTLQGNTDVVIGAQLAGSGNLIITGGAGTSIGIGTGQTGSIALSDAEVANLVDGWALIIFGSNTVTGDINISAKTWTDSVQFKNTGAGIINVNGAQTMGTNYLYFLTDSNINIGAALTGTGGNLYFGATSGNNTFAIGSGQTGTIAFSDTELSYLTDGWGGLYFGYNGAYIGTINVAAHTWTDNVTFGIQGAVNINGDQNLGSNNLTIQTYNDPTIGGKLIGTGTLAIYGGTATSIGLGTGQAGTISLSDADIINIQQGWASIIFGGTTNSGTSSSAIINVGTNTWQSHLILQTNNAIININGAQTMGINKNLTLSADADIRINGALTGSGTGILTIAPTTAASMGIGTGQGGIISLGDSDIANITDGWAGIVFGNSGSNGYIINVGAFTWLDNVTFQTGHTTLNINGTQNLGSNNLTLISQDVGINADLIGTGTLVLRNKYTTNAYGIGTGQAGTYQLSDTELDHIKDGWSNLIFGWASLASAMNVGSYTWKDNVTFISNTGSININGSQTLGKNDLTIQTNADPSINAALAGTGTLTFINSSSSMTMGIGTGQAGTINLSNIELGYILAGWNNIIFNSQSAAMNIGAYNWGYDVTFKTNSSGGIINVNGAQTANNMMFEAYSLNIAATLAGTGTLTIRQSVLTNGVAIGTASGTLSIDDTELSLIQDGWKKLVFGRSDSIGGISLAATGTWKDDVQFISGTSNINVTNDQNFGTNNATFSTNADIVLSNNLIGTGNLRFETNNGTNLIGIGTGQTGTLQFTTTELTRLVDGWNSIQFGNATQTGTINIGGKTWTDRVIFMTNGNIDLKGGQGTTETTGTTMTFVSLNGSFINSTGSATPINPGSGRYLIYSVSAATDSYNGLSIPTSVNQQTYFSYSPSAVIETGNTIIYSSGASKILYLQIDDKVKIYGDSTPNYTYTYLGGLMGSDTLNAALLSASLSAAGASLTDNAGTTRAITGSFNTGLGYTVQVTNGTLTVTKAPVLVVGSSLTREYGDTVPLGMTYIGLKNSETSSVIDTLATITGATTTSNVGNYAVTLSNAADNNYTFNYTDGSLTITKATLTVTADNKSRDYGDANPALTVSYSGFKNGETSSVIDVLASAASTATATTNAGTATITSSGASDNNYTFVYNNGTLTINKATLTATASNGTREYGDANPGFTVAYSGFKNGETSAVIDTLATASSSATATTNVGTASVVASGAIDNNYNFNYVNGTLTITKAHLTATAQNASREYGDANPGFTVAYTGFKNGETSSVIDTLATASSTANATTNVGTATITASGAVDNNYDFTYNNGTLTINKATVTVTADNKSREYGDANPTFTASYSGFKNGETSSVIDALATVSSTATVTTNAGTATIAASGASDNNYTFTYNSGTLTINKATLTATASNGTREYGDANPAFTVAYTGFKNGETSSVIDTLATASSSATATTNVGSTSVVAFGATDNNYNFNYIDGTLNITKAHLTATAQNASREYGDTNPAFAISYTGFKNGETASVIDTLATASSVATSTTNAGTASIVASGAADSNYDFTYNNGTLTINKATVTVTADNKNRYYGDANPAFTASYSGFKNGETSSVIDTLATASSTANATTNAGTAVITASGASDNNYNFVYNDGVLTIDKAVLTATASNGTREYGDANSGFTVSYSGFKNGETSTVIDTLATASSAATATTNAGTASVIASGASDNNYDFSYVNGTLTITKAHLTATAQNASREYGDTNPAFVVSYSGFKNGETASVIDTLATASSTANGTTNVGTATITASGAADNNYDFTYNNGALTINKATATVIVDNKSKYEGDMNPSFTYSISGMKNGESSSLISGIALATSANNTSPVGNYAITASGGIPTTNYQIAYVTGTLQVLSTTPPAPVTPPVTGPILPPSYEYVATTPSTQITLNSGYGFTPVINSAQPYLSQDDNGTQGYVEISYQKDPFAFGTKATIIYIDPKLYNTQPNIVFSTANNQKFFVMEKRNLTPSSLAYLGGLLADIVRGQAAAKFAETSFNR